MQFFRILSRKPENTKKSIRPPERRKEKVFLQKLSESFLLPIAILPFAGLLLTIGGTVGSNFDNQGAQDFANFLNGMSDVIFANIGVLFAIAISIYFTSKNRMYSGFMVIIGYLCFNGVQSAFIHYSANEQFENIFYFHTNSDLQYLVTSSLGITTLETSVFGGIVIGLIVAFIMNRWSDIELPVSLNFFSGVKFVPMILIPVSALLAIITLIFWPFLGLGISWMGNVTDNAPAGLDVFVYGALARALMPFGLHHILNGLAMESSLGGSITDGMIISAGENLGIQNTTAYEQILQTIRNETWNGSVVGDIQTWNFINSLPVNHVPINNQGMTVPVFDWFADYVGVYAGRFLQEYPAYLGMQVGIGLAIIFAAYKKNRRRTAGLIVPSILVSFFTSITEPLDFTYLLVAPSLYYVITVPFFGLSFMLMKVSGAHVGSAGTAGIIDLFVLGAVPASKGTRFWLAFPYSAVEALFCFLFFFFAIKKFGFKTPGRKKQENRVIPSKRAKQTNIKLFLEAYGGLGNLISVSACSSRLRVIVQDVSKVNEKKLVELGSQGFIKKGNITQNILGGKADIISGKINDFLLKTTK